MENNTWYKYDENTDLTVVFVHGFFSSAAACWKSEKANVHWPELLKQDKRLPPLSIFMGGYYTKIDSGDYGVRECVDELFRAISRRSAGGEAPVFEKKNLVFVCHSLGGIVVRYMLESKRESFEKHRIGLVLMASPSVGSDYADQLLGIIKLYKNRLGKQLTFGNDLLVDLDARFKQFVDRLGPEKFVGIEAVEHKAMFGSRWLPGFEPIVLKESAARYFANSQVIPGTNHSSIVKPTGLNHPSHNFFVDFLTAEFLDNNGVVVKTSSVSGAKSYSSLVNRGPLFDIYDAYCEPYYLERKIDLEVARDFSVASFWLHGPSGAGKTSIIKRLLEDDAGCTIEMCFSQCMTAPFRDAFISEMVETIHLLNNEEGDAPERSLNSLVQVLVKKIKLSGRLTIYIDEVPVGKENCAAENELIGLIEDILTRAKQLSNANDLRIVVSSIGKPDFFVCKNVAKVSSYLKVRECFLWGREELGDLLELIIEGISDSVSIADFPANLIECSRGSPRFLKNFFKTRISQPGKSDEEVLMMSAYGFQS